MNKKLAGFLTFAVMIGLLIAALRVMNWLPLAMQKDTIRRYASVEEVRAALGIREIYVPSYFPQQITWPPATILAQGKPFHAIVMEFTRADKRNIVLVISQSEGGALNVDNPIKITTITQKVRYTIKDRDATLNVGTCEEEQPCSEITWHEGKYTLTVLMKSAPFELTKIVESMIR
jgi:hypothetical protein